MAGFSLTFTHMKAEWHELWTASAETPLHFPALSPLTPAPAVTPEPHTPEASRALPKKSTPVTRAPLDPHEEQGTPTTHTAPNRYAEAGTATSYAVLDRYAEIVSQVRDNLTTLDQLVGDGDFGDNLAGGVRRAVKLNESGTDGMSALVDAFLNEVGGTSGPLFGLLFQHLATVPWPDDQAPDALAVAEAARFSLAAIHRVGGAEVGDCTLVDALAPANTALASAVPSTSPLSPDALSTNPALSDAPSTSPLPPSAPSPNPLPADAPSSNPLPADAPLDRRPTGRRSIC
ncbi:DAK2 domain-containing protein [Nonomuraea sp. NPDC050790]|uniref:DAK2 domain-containing protein n=1 Tax=Nonomuraea sp. NPDC050790 TaxID=3364371 RepID=UPI00379566F5